MNSNKPKAKKITWAISVGTAQYPYELRKRQYFNLSKAEMDIWYELWEHYTGWRGKIKWRLAGHKIYTEAGPIFIKARGDLAWAKRIAKQFSLKVPK